MRHAAELGNILSRDPEKSVLFVYSDGGPDHRVTYVSVQLALISMFLKFDLDYLCAACTAPSHSWRNPVERITSTLSLGLQSVGLIREEMDSEFEAESAKCNSLKYLRNAASHYPDFQATALDSVSHVKVLLLRKAGAERKEDKRASIFLRHWWAMGTTTGYWFHNKSWCLHDEICCQDKARLDKVHWTLLCTATLLVWGKEVW